MTRIPGERRPRTPRRRPRRVVAAPIPLGLRDSDVLAVDPGLENPGAALVRDYVLVAATCFTAPADWHGLPLLERCARVASMITHWTDRLVANPRWLVAEWPQWYPGSSVKPGDLAGLCGIAGAVAGALVARGCPLQCLSPTPAEVWGQTPKVTTGDPWRSPRAKMLARRLEPAERAAVADYHDAIDAAGLALWAVGRWERVVAMPGAI